ncbi:MAG TPA: MarR family transcriptional regulator [Streptosporangiaceae bacterium]|nr:MarR family transcriptional regulator [Streptosporangiaceae bacterium]
MDTRDLGMGDLSALGPVAEWPVWRLFMLATRMAGPAWGRLLEQHGVSPAGFFVLRMLHGEDGLRAGEVARRLLTSPATVTSVADTLERHGQLERRRDGADRRAVLLHITDAGRNLVQVTSHDMAPEVLELFGGAAPEDEPAVRRFLLSLIGRFDAYLKGDRP